MPDLAQLEQSILAEIAGAGDEAALEALRVAALGKNGSISALLKTLGTLAPDERKTQGPLINGLKDHVNAALVRAARRSSARRSTRGSAPRASTSRCRCAKRRPRSAASTRSAR